MVITTAQFVFGFVAVIIIGRQGGNVKLSPLRSTTLTSYTRVAQVLPPIPLDAFRLCIFTHHRTLEIVFTSLSLLFGTQWIHQRLTSVVNFLETSMHTPDFLAFSVIMFYATRSKRRSAGLKVQTLLGTVAEDATVYFLVIFTAHVVLQMTLIFGAVSLAILYDSRVLTCFPVACYPTPSRPVSPWTFPARNHAHFVLYCRDQWYCRVSSTLGLLPRLNNQQSILGIFL